MNKTDFADELAKKMGIPHSRALKITNAMIDILVRTLNTKEKIQFISFGTFEVRQTPERMARNPKTKEAVMIPRRYKAVFRQSPRLLDTINVADTEVE